MIINWNIYILLPDRNDFFLRACQVLRISCVLSVLVEASEGFIEVAVEERHHLVAFLFELGLQLLRTKVQKYNEDQEVQH